MFVHMAALFALPACCGYLRPLTSCHGAALRPSPLQAGRMAGVQAMAADPALSLYVVGDSMRALVARLSDPDTLPEFPKLQVRVNVCVG